MGWHICLIDTTDSHRLGTNDKLSEVSTNHSLSHPALINQHKHYPTQTVNRIFYCYCFPGFRASLGGNQTENGGKGRLTACTFFSLWRRLIWSIAEFPISPSQGHWPLLKITRVSYGLLSSPLFYLQKTHYSVSQSLQMNIINHASTSHWTITPKWPTWGMGKLWPSWGMGKLDILPPGCQLG